MLRVALPFGDTPESKRDSYRNALRSAGIEPAENVTSLDGLDGLLLAGGADVDPSMYGEDRGPETETPDADRDALEHTLLREALDRDLPVLAICRGLQFLNVALGGTLLQHIEGHKWPGQRDVHEVSLAPGSKLSSILASREYVVNSRHHQCVKRVASGLAVTATSAGDGVVEGLEYPAKRFVVAVQWHPESRTDGTDARLFEAFRAALDASPATAGTTP